jgi:TPR repeat protein
MGKKNRYKKSAEQDNKRSQYILGLHYEIKKEFSEALYWYKESSQLNYSNAQNKLGEFYENGISIEKDIHQAIYW